jgi:hypothetical protein
VVEYEYDENARFIGFWFVSPDRPPNSNLCTRSRYFDLSRVRRTRSYDKQGCHRLIRDFRRNYFGPHTRLTRERCEAFSSDEENFVHPRPRQERIGGGASGIRETQSISGQFAERCR